MEDQRRSDERTHPIVEMRERIQKPGEVRQRKSAARITRCSIAELSAVNHTHSENKRRLKGERDRNSQEEFHFQHRTHGTAQSIQNTTKNREI